MQQLISDPELMQVVLFGSFASIGGGLSYLLRTVKADKKISTQMTFIEAFSSGFAGIIAMLICWGIGLSWHWSAAIVGISGWMGAYSTIETIKKLIHKKAGFNFQDKVVKKGNNEEK